MSLMVIWNSYAHFAVSHRFINKGFIAIFHIKKID